METFIQWYEKNKDRFDNNSVLYTHFHITGNPYAFDLPHKMDYESAKDFILTNWVNSEKEFFENVSLW